MMMRMEKRMKICKIQTSEYLVSCSLENPCTNSSMNGDTNKESHPCFPLICIRTAKDRDDRIQRDDEFSDSEDEGLGGRRNHQSHREGEKDGSIASGMTTGSGGKDKGKGKAKEVVGGTGGEGKGGLNGGSGGSGKKPRKAGASKSASPTRAQGGGDNGSGPSTTTSGKAIGEVVSTGAIIPAPTTITTTASTNPTTPALSLDEDIDMEALNREMESRSKAESGGGSGGGATTEVVPELFSNHSILPVGKLANEVGETTPEASSRDLKDDEMIVDE